MRPQIVTIGEVANSAPLVVDRNQANFKLGLQLVIETTATASVQATMDDPQGASPTWFDVSSDLTDATASVQGNIVIPVQAVRLEVTAHTAGDVTLTVLQGDS